MALTLIGKSSIDARPERAALLAKQYGYAREILNFYREIAILQSGVVEYLQSSELTVPGDGRTLPGELDFVFLLPRFQSFLARVGAIAPEELASAARELESAAPEQWEELLSRHWTQIDEPQESAQFMARAFLQPIAEYLAGLLSTPDPNYQGAECPRCTRKPVVGVLRPEGDGGRRSLICCLCATEWNFRRIVCAACGEQDVERLPVYTAADVEHVRVEACDSCHTFIKTVDLTRNGLAVPIVDEIATVPLTLWAQEKGYTKLQSNLLGM
jgi:FdhE protein